MAKVKFGGGVTDMRGSIAGNVFSRNGGGAYVRQKVTPINPNTSRQQTVRGRLNFLAKQWALLTPGLRIAWKNFGINHPKTNSLGEVVVLNGLQSYQRINLVILNLSEVRTDTPPPNFDIADIDLVAATINKANNQVEIELAEDQLNVNTVVEVRMTQAISTGVSFVNNLLRFLGRTDGAPTTTEQVDIPASFGELVVGETRAVGARFSNFVNGAQSQESIIFTEVIAGP